EILSKHPKVRKIIDPKTVICICDKKIHLDRNYDPDLLDRYVKNKICKSNDGNTQITQFFSTQNSDISKKRKLCTRLNDEKVKLYLRRVGFVITFGGAPPPDIENDQLLDILRSQAKWINDSTTFCVRSTECSTYVDGINKVCRQCHDLRKSKNAIDKPMPKEKNKKYTSLVLYKNSPFYQYCKNANVMELLEYFNDPEDCTPKFWNHSSPHTYAIFQKNLTGRTIRNICVQRAQSDLALDDPSICFENMAKFRKFLNSINYDRPIAASTDNTKLEEKLRYSASLDAILGSILLLQETLVSSYDEIDTIVKKIQTNNAIAKYVHIYILQVPIPKVPPFVLGIISNNSENVLDVYKIHKQVLELAAYFKIHILSIGADGASIEIKAQKCIMETNTETKLEFNDELYELSKSPNSALYHADVLNVDKQDDGAAYRLFSYEFLHEVSQTLNSDSKNKGLLIYLFIIRELIDSYLNREISNHERIKMVMIGSLFLKIWKQFIQNATNKYKGIFSNDRNINDLNSNLKIWPTDDEIRVLINDAYKEANALAKCVSMVVTLKPEVLLFSTDPLTSEIIPIEENLTKESQDSEKVLTEIAKMIGNVASLNLRNDIDEDLIDAREQIKNLSNNTYLQQTYDNNPDILDNDNNIIFDILYQRRKYHKAYTSKKMI
ncbi:17376_t:CDS:2, partial [Funneliformis geosporum]